MWLCAFASCVEVVVVSERSCVLQSCIIQILSGGSLCGKSCVDDIVKNLLGEGGDVEQWLEPRNIYRCLQLIHFLSLSFISCIDSYCSYLICLVLFVCLTCVEPREFHIVPQLLFRGI